MSETIVYVPGRIKSAVKGGHVAGAEDIIDDALGKEQSVINQEVVEDVSRVEQKVDDIGDAIQFDEDGDLVTVDGDDFSVPDASAKIPTIGAIKAGADTLGIVYDVSAKNPTAGPNNDGKFTLEYILNNANTLIPTSVRKGGMSIKFVCSSDNKYVQCRLMLSTFTTAQFTDAANWQGVDDEPTARSNNLVKSGGTKTEIFDAKGLFNVDFYLSEPTAPTVLLGNLHIKSGDKFDLVISGDFVGSNIYIGGSHTLNPRIVELAEKDVVYHCVAPADLSEIWLFISQLTTAGNFNLKIKYGNLYDIDSLKENQTQIGNRLTNVEKKTLPIVPLFDIKENLLAKYTPTLGYFIQPNGAVTENAGWEYVIVDVEENTQYSITRNWHMTCFYDADGNYVSGGSATSPDSELMTVPSGVAKMAVSFQQSSAPTMTVVKSTYLVRSEQTGGYPTSKYHDAFVIEVGAGKQFTKVVDAFNFAANITDKKIKIFIYKGEYDIYDELGGDTFMENADPSATWNQLQPVFVGDVEIIGVGEVTLKLEIPDNIFATYRTTAVKLSIINNRANIVVDNINFLCKNCRYAIHDECDWTSAYDNTLHIIKNCRVLSIGRTCIGIGASASRYVIENVQLDNQDHNDNALYFHTWPVNTGVSLVLSNFVSKVGKVLLSVYNETYKSVVQCNNCYFQDSLVVNGETQEYSTNIYQIICCNTNISAVVFGSNITSNPYTPEFFNW